MALQICWDKALKAHALVLPVEGSTSRRGNAAPATVKEERLTLLDNLFTIFFLVKIQIGVSHSEEGVHKPSLVREMPINSVQLKQRAQS